MSYFKKSPLYMGFITFLFLLSCSEIQENLKSLTEPPPPPDPTAGLKDKVSGEIGKAGDLLQKNEGKSVVTGVLQKEGTIPGKLGKITNAQGTTRISNFEKVPLTDAVVLFYDALNPSSKPEYETSTDSTGSYYAVVKEGKYFAFAVKFDPLSMELITARIDNIQAKADTVIKVAETTAAEDEISPTVLSVYDATSSDENGIFLLSGIPNVSTKINIAFSEPMDRNSTKGIVLGRLDTSSSSFALMDSISKSDLEFEWSGDNSVLTVSYTSTDKKLDTTSQYGLYMPTSIKDLASNKLEKSYKATFIPVSVSTQEPFTLASNFPEDADTLKPTQNILLNFTQPVEFFSAMKGLVIVPDAKGTWEVLGRKVVYKSKNFVPGQSYTITMSKDIKGLDGKTLGKEVKFGFVVGKLEGIAAGTTEKSAVARIITELTDAYSQGDITRFASYFHENLRIDDGLSKDEFIRNIRSDVERRNLLAGGFAAPEYDASTDVCSKNIYRWKVKPYGADAPVIWVETQVPAGSNRRVWDADGKEISSQEIQWISFKPELKYKDKVYGYDANFTSFTGPVTTAQMQGDFRFFNDMLQKTSSVSLTKVTMSVRENFDIDTNLILNDTKDTAKIAVRNITVESPNRKNFEPHFTCNVTGAADTSRGVLLFVLVKNAAGIWKVTFVSNEQREEKDFNQNIKYDESFNNFNQISSTPPIPMYAPVGRVELKGIDAKLVAGKKDILDTALSKLNINFKFKKVSKLDSSKKDLVGGYLVGISEDRAFVGNRGLSGLLLFVRQGESDTVSFTLSGRTEPSSNAVKILKNVRNLGLPGWDRVFYDLSLDRMYGHDFGLSGVYYWKVVAIGDTSAAKFLENGFKMDKFYGESDFFKGTDFGSFAVGTFPDPFQINTIMTNQGGFTQQGTVNQPIQNNFSDMDLDGYPDFIEKKYLTRLQDKSDFPDFSLDSDQDGMPDFLEIKVMKLLRDSTDLTDKFASDLSSQWKLLKDSLGLELIDTDGDKFPNDIEELKGFDPRNPNSNPGYRAKANLPIGTFTGKLAIGDRFEFKALLIKSGSNDVWVKYTAYIKGDTLSDSVKSLFLDGIGEFIFPIRITSGPNSGQSYLLRGHYQQAQSLFQGPVDLVASVPKNQNNFGSGPYAGQFAMTSRTDINVDNFLGGMTGPNPGPINDSSMTNNNNNNTMQGYRTPPPGVAESVVFHFSVVNGRQVIHVLDGKDTLAFLSNREFSDSQARLKEVSKVMVFAMSDGRFDLNGEYQRDTSGLGEGFKMFGNLGMTRQNNQDTWVLNGGANSEERRCKEFNQAGDCLGTIFDTKPGELSAYGDLASLKIENKMLVGKLNGWISFNQFFNQAPYLGTVSQFTSAASKMGVDSNETFYIKVQENSKVYQVKLSSEYVSVSYSPECGNPAFVRIIPNSQDDLQGMYTKRPEQWMTSPQGAQLILMEERPGVPLYIDNLKDEKGISLDKGGFVVSERPVMGPMCKENNIIQPDTNFVIKDNDKDCVDDQFDSNPFNVDIPTKGGECGANQPNVLFFNGDKKLLDSAIQVNKGIVYIQTNDGKQSEQDVGTQPEIMFNSQKFFYYLETVDTTQQFVFLASSTDVKMPRIRDGKAVLVQINKQINPPINNADSDKDCIPDAQDPAPTDFNNPKQGGSCNQTQPIVQDQDKDCVPDAQDPAPNDFNNPKQGGTCNQTQPIVQDQDKDCVPDTQDPAPTDFNNPKQGGTCNQTQPIVQDQDKDCVPDTQDPAPTDFNNPKQGGTCNV